MVAAALIGAGASLLGGLFGRSSQNKANAQNAALQKEFAKNSIQWKTEDAKKAGIHPLYALNAPTMSAAPSYVGDTSMPTALANMGQDISRAVDATRSSGDRADAYTKTVQSLNLTRMGLENDLLASQIAKINQAGRSPGIPAVGMVDEAGQSMVGPLATGAGVVKPVKSLSDAELMQSRYGEPGEWIFGAHNLVADFGTHLGNVLKRAIPPETLEYYVAPWKRPGFKPRRIKGGY